LQESTVLDIENLFAVDQQLRKFEGDIRARYGMFEKTRNAIDRYEGLDSFAQGYKWCGVHVWEDGSVTCWEWVPDVKAELFFFNVFSADDCEPRKFEARDFGKWELHIPARSDGTCAIQHLNELKLIIETHDNERIERISPWAKYVRQQSGDSIMKWFFWNPPQHLQEVIIPKPDRLRLYEAHVGIASDRYEVATYKHFTSNVLPRIRDLGYNSLLLMAVVEHPCYASFGQQTTNYFAPSSRFGTPDELKDLIATAHSMGIYVIMDVMHGEASANVEDGLNKLNGADGGFFVEGGNGGKHDTRKFDFTKWETLRFLLSQLRFYLDEFKVDGFRFRELTGMVYLDNSAVRPSSDDYSRYFGPQINMEATAYLMLMNDLLHKFYPDVLTIAEEHSGFPGITRPVNEGGIGFDYKMAVEIPDKWMKMICETRDEDWSLNYIQKFLTNQRPGEKRIVYVENHEQVLLHNIDRITLSRKLIGELPMLGSSETPIELERGLSLYKMVRLLTHVFSGRGIVNFIGNEFGHPDWVELPAPTNGDNFKFARRRFQLADDEQLRYKYLNRFDIALNKLEEKFGWLKSNEAKVTRVHESDKVLAFERSGLVFIFNFHPTNSYNNYRIPVRKDGSYHILLDSDERFFNGGDRNQRNMAYHTTSGRFEGCDQSIMLPTCCRTCLLLRRNHS
uniref:1,4-alpha-glucan branching enzyme n=1 Tax=Ciona savignyi TaxID=51511 RepID=H2Y7M0_CIOSA